MKHNRTQAAPALFGISDAARLVGVAENTLRKYERAGVISPLRDSTRKRLFTEAEIDKARQHHERARNRRGSSE